MTSNTQAIVNLNGITENDRNNNAKNIYQLFSNSDQIRIPAYQRAYSWEQKHCSQFFDDLLEQKGKRYYLGQMLFEKDGQTPAIPGLFLQ